MELNKKTIHTIIAILFGAVLLQWVLANPQVLYGVFRLIAPFTIGGVIAFILNVPMRRVEKGIQKVLPHLPHSLKRILSYLLTLLAVLAIIALTLFVVIPQLVESFRALKDQIPAALNAGQVWLDHLSERWPDLAEQVAKLDLTQFNLNVDKMIDQISNAMQAWGASLVDFGVNAVGSVISALTNFVIGIVFSVYILLQKEKLSGQFKQIIYAIMPTAYADETLRILRLTDRTFTSFLSGQCVEAVILGSMFTISMALLRMPYAVMVGVLICVTALIPIVGAFVGCVVGVFCILIVSPKQALIFLILFVVLQQVEGNLIYPHVVGSSVGLPSIWVLVAVTIGGKLLGVMGIFLFIPLGSVLYTLFREYVKSQLRFKKISREKWEKPGAV